MLDDFKCYELWYDLTEQQQQSEIWRSTLYTILHKRAEWKHAAQAIMQYPLPILQRPTQFDDATDHIDAIEQFAQELAAWLQGFASGLCAYKLKDSNQKDYEASLKLLRKRTR